MPDASAAMEMECVSLLALSLSLIQSANGFLLIDEIDTGLHWTSGSWLSKRARIFDTGLCDDSQKPP